jgi:hypothetical protein
MEIVIFIAVILNILATLLVCQSNIKLLRYIAVIYRYFKMQLNRLEKSIQLLTNNKVQVFLVGESKMNGENLIYTITRPSVYDADVRTWTVAASIAGATVKTIDQPIVVESTLLAIKKGTRGVAFAVTFTDAAGNVSAPYISDTFDVIDNIPPNAPSSVTIAVREETAGDDESAVLVESPEPVPDETIPDGETENGNSEETEPTPDEPNTDSETDNGNETEPVPDETETGEGNEPDSNVETETDSDEETSSPSEDDVTEDNSETEV